MFTYHSGYSATPYAFGGGTSVAQLVRLSQLEVQFLLIVRSIAIWTLGICGTFLLSIYVRLMTWRL